MKTAAAPSRAVETELTVDAPAEAVWKAVADAEELVRWFPAQAEVSPGEGGSVRLAWDGNWASESRIEIWEPPRRLRTVTEQRPFGAPEVGVWPQRVVRDRLARPVSVLVVPPAVPAEDPPRPAHRRRAFDGRPLGERPPPVQWHHPVRLEELPGRVRP